MKPEARARLVPLLIACGEGSFDSMYRDREGIVTVGVGNALFSVASALAMTWTHGHAGPTASAADVREAWAAVMSRTDLIGHGGGAYREVTTIRATPASLAKLIDDDVERFERELRPFFPGYDDAPAAAQLGLMRLAWACGGDFADHGKWPNFRRAWAAQQWRICAVESRIPALDVDEPRANALEAALFLETAGDEPAPDTEREPAIDVADGGQDRPVYRVDLSPDTEPPAAA